MSKLKSRGRQPKENGLTVQIMVRCTPAEVASYEAAAARTTRKRSDWIRVTLDRGARER